MMWSSSLLFCVGFWILWTALVAASPLLDHNTFDLLSQKQLPRRQSPTGPVAATGVTSGNVQPRLEIRQLQQNADMWNVYILGLNRFQRMSQDQLLSYHQIAGIHGRPFQSWDNAVSSFGPQQSGYCPHRSNLFLSWHRPYLALFEQLIYQNILDAVSEFPNDDLRRRYQTAASNWRMPYWDWAAPPANGGSVYPTVISNPTIQVVMANGTNTIRNPLYSYRFQSTPVAGFYFEPYADWTETKRYPTDNTLRAVSQNNLVASMMDSNRAGLMDRLYNLFTNYDNFTEFGNEVWLDQGIANADSLEAVHDLVHAITGMNGHMTYLDFSAFDPVFWLHHTMVDRCFALWQALHPNSYVEPMASVGTTFAWPTGAVLDVGTPLMPFYKDTSGNFWSSAEVSDTRTFGYTYSELLGNNPASSVANAVNQLYGGNSAKTALASSKFVQGSSDTNDQGQYREYFASIVTSPSSQHGSYAIYLFIGEFDEDPASWPFAPNLAGMHAVVVPFGSTNDMGQARVSGSIPLTQALLTQVQGADLNMTDSDTVESYLKSNLSWRAATFDGTIVSKQDLGDLKITVASSVVTPASNPSEFPEWKGLSFVSTVT